VDPTTILTAARAALDEQAQRTTDLIRSLPGSAIPVPGSDWTIRELAVHLVLSASAYAEMATGSPSPLERLDKESVASLNAAIFADIPETDPGKLAILVLDAVERFLDATDGRAGDQPVNWHAGFRHNVAGLACIVLGEHLVHGYEIATATGRPWPIDPKQARLVVHAYAPASGLWLNPATTAGLSASYGIGLRGGEGFIVRFTDGVYCLEPAGSGSVDCTISADPVAFLLATTGRLTQDAAIALGLWSVGGDRPDLALGFNNLFIFP
jgi:uncharacterized protein (TIGR03083 family)